MNWTHEPKIKMRAALAAVVACLLAGGCGDEFPEVSEDKTQLIANYSAALLMKYDVESPSRLLPADSVVHIDFVDPSGGMPAEIVPEQDDESGLEVNSTPEYSSENVTVNDTVTGDSSGGSYDEGFSGFLTDLGVDVSFSGNYEVVNAYPDGDDANPYLSVAASDGNELLVLHFNMSNTSGAESSVNLGRLGLRYRVSINGGTNKYVMTTLLENDLLSYVGTLGPGEMTDLVAVCEISDAEASSISTIDFTIRDSTRSSVISLQ